MEWAHYICCFFGGAFLANAIPHLVSGVTGHAFQTPFAKPPGKGLSSSIVNVLWGYLNLLVAYVLLCRINSFDIHDICDVAVTGLGALLISLHLAYHFGQFHGGRKPG